MKSIFSGSIHQVVMLVVCLLILPPLGILLASGVQSYQASYADVERRNLRIVDGIAEREHTQTQNTLAILNALQQVSAFKSFNDAFSNEVFSNLIQEYPVFENIYILSPQGRVLSSGLSTPPDIDVGRLLTFARSLNGEPYGIASRVISPFTNQPVKRFVLPLEGRTKDIYAYLCADLNLHFSESILAGQPIPVDGIVYLLSDKGELVLSSLPPLDVASRLLPDDELWLELRGQDQSTGVFFFTTAQGSEVFAVFKRLDVPGTDLPYMYTVMTVPKDRVSEVPAAMLHRDVMLVSLAAVVAFVTGLLLCHWGFALPIRSLLDAANRLGQGDLQARTTDHKYLRDELAAINEEFNNMAAALETRSIQLEEAKDVATRSAKAKSEFLANMSHEIRTPMNAILGMTHLVGKTALTNNQKGQVDKIRDAADDLLRLLNNILDFSKIEAGKMPTESITFHAGRLFTAARGIADAAAVAAGVGLVSNIPSSIPPQLVGDPSRLAQALGLLLQAAISHSRGNPVELGCVVDSKNSERVALTFTVNVYGVKLEQKTLAHVANCLSGLDRGVSRLDSAELGLMLAGSIMHLFGGASTVRNTAQGFSFTCSLELELPRVLEQDHSLRFDGEKLLLAGGSQSMRSALRKLLEGYNLRVREEADPVFAAELLKLADMDESPFAAVIVELPFTDADGVAKIEALKHGAGLSHPPLLVLTAHQDSGPPPSTFFEAGLDAYLPRPVNESLLVDSLAGLILARKEHEKANPSAKSIQTEEVRFDGLSVLLVEDNAVNREIAREVLENAGTRVFEAVNGLDAVEQCDKTPLDFDMVLMDLEMPGMDGLTATKTIRSRPRLSRWRLPIIAMTAHSGTDEVMACFEAGMNDYITKPLVLRDMFAAIRRWLPLKPEDRRECLGVLRKLLGVLKRSHARDPQLELLLDALKPLLHEGCVQALRDMLERQDQRAARAMIRELLTQDGDQDKESAGLLQELDAADAGDAPAVRES